MSPPPLRRCDYAPGPFGQVHFRAIGVDTPGFGMSTAPPHPPTIEEYADSISAVLDHLAIERAFILGQHTGSMIAMEATLRHPQRYAGLILHTPTPFDAQERAQWSSTLTPRQRAFRLKTDGSHLVELWNRRCAASGHWTHLAAMHREVIQMLRAGDTLWYGHAASFVYDQLGRLGSIRVPSLILTNSGDLTFPIAQRARERRPDFEYVELPGGTHDIVDEQPEAVSRAIEAFVRARTRSP